MKKIEEITRLFPSMKRVDEAEVRRVAREKRAYDDMWTAAFREWDRVIAESFRTP